jgi:hypothetical protein
VLAIVVVVVVVAFQSTNALTTSSKRRFFCRVHWGGNGRAANLPCFHHGLGKSFGIPAILFYQASDANKTQRGGDLLTYIRDLQYRVKSPPPPASIGGKKAKEIPSCPWRGVAHPAPKIGDHYSSRPPR